MRTLGSQFSGRHNNFDAIRLAAATAVIVSHAFLVETDLGEAEPLFLSTGQSLGQHAVNIFFIVSGFLVAASLERSTWRGFCVSRVLRIYPALIVAALVTAFLLGPALTVAPLAAYFEPAGIVRFLAHTVGMLDARAPLPGLFTDLPVSGVAMLTVWTLKYEVLFYAALLLAGTAGLMHLRWSAAAALSAVLVLCFAWTLWADPAPTDPAPHLLRLGSCFLIGVAAWRHRGRIPLSAPLMLLLAAIAWLAFGTPLQRPAIYFAEAYAVLWFALLRIPAIGTLELPGDISYGLYLYGWPVTQAAFQLQPGADPWLLIAFSLPASALLATASWILIERPALALRRRLRGAKAGGVVPAAS